MKRSNGMMTRMLSLILVLLLMLSLFACSKQAEEVPEEVPEEPEETVVPEAPEEPEPEPEEEPVEEEEPEPEPEPEKGPFNPLTGEATEEDISASRPIGVMVNNISVAQPQLGLRKADMVYEVLVEAGITRMFAIFQKMEPDNIIGSIRSSRHYYLQLVTAYDAIYVHCGASPQADNELATGKYDHIDGNTGAYGIFYRDQWRRSNLGYEHSLCFTSDSLINCLPETGFRLEHKEDYDVNMAFTEEGELQEGQEAKSVTVTFSGVGKQTIFKYDEEKMVYYPRQFGSDYVDGDTNEKVPFRNVIVMQTEVWGIPGDNKGRVDMTLTGSGKGWYIRDGVCSPVTWTREKSDMPFTFTYEDGTEITYGVGKTYVCIIANSGSFSVE